MTRNDLVKIHIHRFVNCFMAFAEYKMFPFSSYLQCSKFYLRKKPSWAPKMSTLSKVAFLSFPGFQSPFKDGEGIR